MSTYTLNHTGEQLDSIHSSEQNDVAADTSALRNVSPANNDRVRVTGGAEYVWVDGDQSLEVVRSTGTNTSTSQGKLIDSGATFSTDGVTSGDIVKNTTDGTSATVSSVDSETQLTLSLDIFTSSSKAYDVGYTDSEGLYYTSSTSTYGVGEANEGRWKRQSDGIVIAADATSNTVGVHVSGEDHPRIVLKSDGTLLSGDGTAAPTAVVGNQGSAIASLTDSSGGTDDGTIEAVGDTSAGDESGAINNNFSELHTKQNAILAALRAHGLIAT